MLPAYPLPTIDSKSKEGQKLAVGGRNPFQLDAKEPSGNFQDFLMDARGYWLELVAWGNARRRSS